MSRVPRIRFKGFEEDWEQRKLGEVTTSFSGGTPNIGNHDYYGDEIPFIRSGEINNCHTDLFITEKGLVNSSAAMVKEGDILYALYGATSGEVSRSKLKGAINQAILAILPKAKYDSEYIAQWLKTKKRYIVDTYLQGGQGNLSGNIVKNFIVDFSSYNEQLSIGNFASSLDHLITLHQRKLEKFKIIKKSMLENLFPKNGEKTPKIRFSGFTEDWEQRKLGECFTERTESMPKGELISVTINGGIKRFSELGRHDNSNEDKSKYKKVCIGDIAYNSMRMWQGASGYSPYNGIVSPAYTVLLANDGVNSKCIAFQFKLPRMIHVFQINSQGITSDNWNLKFPTLSDISIYISRSIDEQGKIASLLEFLDHLITLHQSKLEKLQKIKKSMLESMFV